YRDYVGYIIASFLCPLSHFLTVSVFLGQGIYALFFLKMKYWLRLGIAGLLAISGLIWWLKFGGGQWTLYTLDYQAKETRRMAETMPSNAPYGTMLPAAPWSVCLKSMPIFGDLLICLSGFADATGGRKNLSVSLFSGFVLIALYHSRMLAKRPIII